MRNYDAEGRKDWRLCKCKNCRALKPDRKKLFSKTRVRRKAKQDAIIEAGEPTNDKQ